MRWPYSLQKYSFLQKDDKTDNYFFLTESRLSKPLIHNIRSQDIAHIVGNIINFDSVETSLRGAGGPSTPYRDVKAVCFCLDLLPLWGQSWEESEAIRNIMLKFHQKCYISNLRVWRPCQQRFFLSSAAKMFMFVKKRNKADMKQWCSNKHQIGSCYAINHILSQSAAALFDSPVMWLGLWLWCHVTGWLVLCLDECFESCVFLTIFSGERKFYDANLVLERGQTQVQVSV